MIAEIVIGVELFVCGAVAATFFCGYMLCLERTKIRLMEIWVDQEWITRWTNAKKPRKEKVGEMYKFIFLLEDGKRVIVEADRVIESAERYSIYSGERHVASFERGSVVGWVESGTSNY